MSSGDVASTKRYTYTTLSLLRGQNTIRIQLVHATSPEYNTLYGAACCSCSITNILRQLRNQAVDDIILAAMRRDDPLGQYDRVSKQDRAKVAPDALPETVAILLPDVTYNDEIAGACTMTALVEIAPLKCASIELTSQNLNYLRVASLALQSDHTDELHFAGTLSRRKRKVSAECKVETPLKMAGVDYRRHSMFIEWTDGGGRKKKHYQKPARWESEEIVQTEQDLLQWKSENDWAVEEEASCGGGNESGSDVGELRICVRDASCPR